jgi:HEAT repeat protein
MRKPEAPRRQPAPQIAPTKAEREPRRNVSPPRRRYREALAEALLKSAPSPEPQEEKSEEELDEEHEAAERSRALFQQARSLRSKIVQRNDGALREAGLAKLATLIESSNPDDLLLGLTSLFHLDEMDVGAERFRPQILSAMSNPSPELRNAALNCLPMVCSDEEALEMVLAMASDASAEVRASAAFNLTFLATRERAQDIEPVLNALLQDSDEAVRKRALVALWKTCELGEGEEQAAKMHGLTETISADPQRAGEVLGWWENRMKFRQEDVQRFADMLSEEGVSLFGGEGYSERTLMGLFDIPFLNDSVRPVVTQLCLQALTDSTDEALRHRALKILPELRNDSLVSALEEIVATPRAAGIEDELKQTIERVRSGPPLPSLKGRRGEREETEEPEEVRSEEAIPQAQETNPEEAQ